MCEGKLTEDGKPDKYRHPVWWKEIADPKGPKTVVPHRGSVVNELGL